MYENKNMCEKDNTFPGKTQIVDLGENSYSIYIGADTSRQFADLFMRDCGGEKAVIITDENVAGLYAGKTADSLQNSGITPYIITVPPGEKSKRSETVERIYEQLFDISMERSDAIIALGGGVVGDLAGFAAATFKRGVNYVQYPTSLLAMVDSSIGGKTGINHSRGKNMIGAFYQPKMVFTDVALLRSLPRRELGCGLAETVKHAVIRDNNFFVYLEQHVEAILQLQTEVMIELVMQNCQIKAQVVSEDEKESGLRGILNYGHTIGHVLETVLPGRDYHHGEAVSLGMIAAGRLAQNRGLLAEADAQRCRNLLEAFMLPTSVDDDLPVDKLYQAMKQDKKVRQGKIRFVLPTAIGKCTFVDDLTESEIKQAMQFLQHS